jgi:two-component system response regulator CpxR
MAEETEPFDPSAHLILVVDDEPDTRHLAKKILEYEGFNVLLAGDGEQAVEFVRDNDVELVLLDVRLPKRDGYWVCTEIKAMENKERIPLVIFFTVLSLNVDRQRGIEAGGDGFLVKPFSADELIDFIKNALQSF